MCADFTGFNNTCPKDPYPLSNIDRLIEGSFGYKTLSFIDTYYDYSQIKMNLINVPKITFMSNRDNYYYNVMPFGLKNVLHHLSKAHGCCILK